jgi:hypothetical protein
MKTTIARTSYVDLDFVIATNHFAQAEGVLF